MKTVNKSRSAGAGEREDRPFRFFCKLFNDMIITEVCLLRRNHFSDRHLFSCRGCSKDTILNSPHSRARRRNAPRP